ncbi:RIDA [Mytilus edulis]|uniref:RidA n=1 Tax=Mytilus edulis TaxID=6550 RepID=A0A8S3R7F7_MYTED|nr:RIDA [Mytilus edulis]
MLIIFFRRLCSISNINSNNASYCNSIGFAADPFSDTTRNPGFEEIPWWRPTPPCLPVTKKIIETDKAPIFNLPFSQAVLTGNTLYLSGQLGIDPVTLKLVPGGLVPETEQIFKNVDAVIEAAGGSMKDVFPEKFPARSSCQVVAISQGAQLEIDVIAVIDKC